ncbi:MAG TPA: hypothetical protein VGD08_21240 [Stellaceae bacterium]|jgi:hypothetical protein
MSAERWLAKIWPLQLSIDDMLQRSFGLDVWERGEDFLIAAAPERVLSELEHCGAARVERISTVRDYVAAKDPKQKN